MLPEDILRLYSDILFHDVHEHSLSDAEMKAAIGSIENVYKPESGSLSSTSRRLQADYDSVVYRCAYLHKYAAFHTAMVYDIVKYILQQNKNICRVFEKQLTREKQFKICSLGGGPGCDTVGVLVAMLEHFGLFPCSASVIDIKSEWTDTLTSVFWRLSSGMCGPVGEGFTHEYFNWEFLTSDLLEELHDDVKSAIGSAELVTMVKFVSAAACDSTEWMLKKIFTTLKLGAVVLFIDNSSGGYREVVSRAATDCNLTSESVPINYQAYNNIAYKITHWGYTSCYSTTVTIHVMQKLRPSPPFINVSSKKIVHSAPNSSNLSSINNDDKPMKRSELEAENVTLHAQLKELQGKNLKERSEFIAKITELKKIVSTNKDRIKILTETIQILEKYKADVADYEIQIRSAQGEISNLKKELEEAKMLQEQSKKGTDLKKKQILERHTRLEKEKSNENAELEKALRETQIQVKEVDMKMTEQVATRKEDFARIEQLQLEKKLLDAEISQLKFKLEQAETKLKEKEKQTSDNEKDKKKRSLSDANKDNAKIKKHCDESGVSPKRRRVLRSKQNKVAEPLDDSKTATEVVAPPKTRTARRKLEYKQSMSPVKNQSIHFMRSEIISDVGKLPTSRVTRRSSRLFAGAMKTEP